MTTRRIGRPPLNEEDEAVSVHLRVASRDYDALWRAARQLRVSVPELIRMRILPRRAPQGEDNDDP
jgi:hypothetical protein